MKSGYAVLVNALHKNKNNMGCYVEAKTGNESEKRAFFDAR